MDWLYQNWILVALAVGAFFLMRRMGGMGGCGMGHSMDHSSGDGTDHPPANDGAGSGTVLDPVSGRAVTPGGTNVSAVYHGCAYYFESRDNRDAFESAPEKYLAGAPSGGQTIGTESDQERRPHRHHGC